MKKVELARIGNEVKSFMLEDNSTIQNLLTIANMSLLEGEVVKSAETEEKIELSYIPEAEEEFVIVKEMKNAY